VNPEMKRDVYSAVFETWRSEVDSYWQRNSYFAAFETAALAGCWYVFEKHHPNCSAIFAGLGLASAVIWWVTSVAVHRYIRYWWLAIKKVEENLYLGQEGLDFAKQHPGSGLRPSQFTLCIPILFGVAWIVLVVVALRGGCSN
jgi:hypothetical protein